MVVRPDGAGRSRRRPLVGGVGIGVDEDDGEGGGAGLDQALGGSRHLGRIDGLSHRAIGQRALGHLDAQVAVGDGGEVAPQAPGVGAVAAAHFQHVAEAAVVITPMRAPLRSSSALVPTVVPWTMEPSAESAPKVFRPSRKPTASSPRFEGTLAVRNVPAASSRKNRSVKVPPTSTPTSVVMPWLPSHSRGAGRARARRVTGGGIAEAAAAGRLQADAAALGQLHAVTLEAMGGVPVVLPSVQEKRLRAPAPPPLTPKGA